MSAGAETGDAGGFGPRPGVRHMFLRDLLVDARIGVYPHEEEAAQRVRINLDLSVAEDPATDRLDAVVDYEPLVEAARRMAAETHTRLVETLAERLADVCLTDPRVLAARVRVEKLDVFPDAAAVGVEIERRRA